MFDEADAIFTLGLGVQQTKVKGILPLAAAPRVAPAPITEWLQLVASVSLTKHKMQIAKRLRANKREICAQQSTCPKLFLDPKCTKYNANS